MPQLLRNFNPSMLCRFAYKHVDKFHCRINSIGAADTIPTIFIVKLMFVIALNQSGLYSNSNHV